MSDASLQTRNVSRGRRDLLFAVGGAAAAGAAAIALQGNSNPSFDSQVSASNVVDQGNRDADLQRLAADLEIARTQVAKLTADLEAAKKLETSRVKALEILRAPTWTEVDLNDFLGRLSGDELASLREAVKLDQPTDAPAGVAEIKKQLHKHFNNVVVRQLSSADNIQYHDKVKWVARKVGVYDEIIESQSTFVVERELSKKLFSDIWDKLNEAQRKQLLSQIDPNGLIKDVAGTVALGGSAALAALSATVSLSGFAFYTTMSVAISQLASVFGVTLSMGAYTGMSSLVAFLSGPIGWAIAGVAGAVGLAVGGRADLQATTAAILQIHLTKVAQLKQHAPEAPNDIFDVVGRIVPR
jgi:uncharacterized protein YaaW (UPF0174 family)